MSLPNRTARSRSSKSEPEPEGDDADADSEKVDLWFICLLCTRAFREETPFQNHYKEQGHSSHEKMLILNQSELLPNVVLQRLSPLNLAIKLKLPQNNHEKVPAGTTNTNLLPVLSRKEVQTRLERNGRCSSVSSDESKGWNIAKLLNFRCSVALKRCDIDLSTGKAIAGTSNSGNDIYSKRCQYYLDTRSFNESDDEEVSPPKLRTNRKRPLVIYSSSEDEEESSFGIRNQKCRRVSKDFTQEKKLSARAANSIEKGGRSKLSSKASKSITIQRPNNEGKRKSLRLQLKSQNESAKSEVMCVKLEVKIEDDIDVESDAAPEISYEVKPHAYCSHECGIECRNLSYVEEVQHSLTIKELNSGLASTKSELKSRVVDAWEDIIGTSISHSFVKHIESFDQDVDLILKNPHKDKIDQNQNFRSEEKDNLAASSQSLKNNTNQESLNPVLCTMCGNMYRSATDLKLHKQRVHRPDEYQCTLCGTGFVSERNIRRHLQIRHAEEFLGPPVDSSPEYESNSDELCYSSGISSEYAVDSAIEDLEHFEQEEDHNEIIHLNDIDIPINLETTPAYQAILEDSSSLLNLNGFVQNTVQTFEEGKENGLSLPPGIETALAPNNVPHRPHYSSDLIPDISSSGNSSSKSSNSSSPDWTFSSDVTEEDSHPLRVRIKVNAWEVNHFKQQITNL